MCISVCSASNDLHSFVILRIIVESFIFSLKKVGSGLLCLFEISHLIIFYFSDNFIYV